MPEKPMSNQEKLELLRKQIGILSLDGMILPRTDEYMGEFLAPYAERLAYLTGFTGSAGYMAVCGDRACVMSDGRYSIQLKQEVDLSLYSVGSSITTSAIDWLESQGGGKIGYDPWLHNFKDIDVMRKKAKNTTLVSLTHNLVDLIWADKPKRPDAPVFQFPDTVAGLTSVEKRALITRKMQEVQADAMVLTLSDSICWLLNVRGGDVSYAPLILSYALLWADGSVDWFIDHSRIKFIIPDVRVRAPLELEIFLETLKTKTVWLDTATAPAWFYHKLEDVGAVIYEGKDPCLALKAIKTHAEQKAIQNAHITDAVAFVRFMKWFSDQNESLTEISIAEKLEEFRSASPDYAGPSFATIAGFAENGAIIHYRATDKTSRQIRGDGLLLLDSGGQYSSGGTTDITRTFAVGSPTAEMQENYTRVLKGHIALSLAKFPEGTLGSEIDILARQSLQEVGLDYAHGTGHGVGCYLGVHEEAANISPKGDKALMPGMVLSNEPGYYKEGLYGIRIENLVLVTPETETKEPENRPLGFKTLTFVPYDKALIVEALLTAQERAWLEVYYQQIRLALSPFLSPEERVWLEIQLFPFSQR